MLQAEDQYMKMALHQAQLAFDKNEVPIGAIVIDALGNILGKGHNQSKQLNDPTAHAEMLAITAAMNTQGSPYLNDCSIYVTVEPCAMCAGALRWAKISKLIYGASESKVGYSLYQPSILHPSTQVKSALLNNECAELMQSFFKKLR
ncbi:MAG: nucleoside deaminase [Bacteroidota bacterium]|nr:nucleoside deaminase [Bacteroidota bacterium]